MNNKPQIIKKMKNNGGGNNGGGNNGGGCGCGK